MNMKRSVLVLGAMIVVTVTLFALNDGAEHSQNAQEIKEVTIGNQIWMSENLNVDKFRNGDPIPQAKTKEEWLEAGKNKTPAWCYYDNDPAKGALYGKLYNWYAVNDPRGLAPDGWSVPNINDWTQLADLFGGSRSAGSALKSRSGWANSGNGTNASGFNALPGGYRGFNGEFSDIDHHSNWWSSTESGENFASFRSLGFISSGIGEVEANKLVGLYVRCIKK